MQFDQCHFADRRLDVSREHAINQLPFALIELAVALDVFVKQITDRFRPAFGLALFFALALLGGWQIDTLGRSGADILGALASRSELHRGIGAVCLALAFAALWPVAD